MARRLQPLTVDEHVALARATKYNVAVPTMNGSEHMLADDYVELVTGDNDHKIDASDIGLRDGWPRVLLIGPHKLYVHEFIWLPEEGDGWRDLYSVRYEEEGGRFVIVEND